MAEKVSKERKYLQENDVYTLETQNRWCQIDVSLATSDISIEVHSAKKLKLPDNSSSTYCLMKVNDISIGKTPIAGQSPNPLWDTALTLELTKDFSVESFTFEVYSNTASPILIGECHVSLDEILDNTLYNNKFNVYLPLNSGKNTSGMHTETGETLKQELVEDMDEREFDNYLDSIFHEGEHMGIIRLGFQVRLDSSFTELVEGLRIQRLENLETLASENDANLQEQLKYLKTSVAPIRTIEVSPELGLVGVVEDTKPKEKKREGVSCGMCMSGKKEDCNIF